MTVVVATPEPLIVAQPFASATTVVISVARAAGVSSMTMVAPASAPQTVSGARW